VRRFLRFVLHGLGFVLFALLLVVAYAGIKIAVYEQKDDAEHLAAKSDYLRTLEESARPERAPNIIFVLYDDLGLGDFGHTGAKQIETPNIDALAADGVQLTQFYSPAPVCTPARFGYLTGRYAERGGLSHVVFPQGHPISRYLQFAGANTRIPAHEITLAEILKSAGYRTGMVGKWHLGDYGDSLPNKMGFDSFFGPLYSNDMKPFALYRNVQIAEPAPFDQTRLSQTYTEEALAFIGEGHQPPFFLYLAHSFPHIPLHVRPDLKGQSRAGLYGDVVEELDDGIGELVSHLEQTGQLENTLIILTSDNGPWFQGSAGPVRGRKGDVFEGGMRVPFIAYWAGQLKGGRVESAMAMGTDLVPTVLDILKIPPPADRVLDGKSLLAVLERGEESPHEFLYYLSGKVLAVRDARYKYVRKRGIGYHMAGQNFSFAIPRGPWLFDFLTQEREDFDITAHRPAVAQALAAELTRFDDAFRQNPQGWTQ